MGCDIHAFLEVKIGGVWHTYADVDLDRDYGLFAYMANVRNWAGAIEPISLPRGLPEDAAFFTKFHSDHWGTDGHSHSWLSFDELLRVAEFAKENNVSLIPWWANPEITRPAFGVYLFGNDITSWKRYPEDYPPALEDVRLVFWFDN
jgi:hypothetical protein